MDWCLLVVISRMI